MKRTLTEIFMVLALLIAVSALDMPQAQAHDKYLNGDTNYEYVYDNEKDGSLIWYLDKSSIVKKSCDTGTKFAETILVVRQDGSTYSTFTVWFYAPSSDDEQVDGYGTVYWSNDGTTWEHHFNAFHTRGYTCAAFHKGWKIMTGGYGFS